MDKCRRVGLLADRKWQAAICTRVIIYWLLCQTCLIATIFCVWWISGSAGSIWSVLIPAVVVSCLVLPLVVIDVISFSNRFAGPITRLRRFLRVLALGGKIPPLHFRKGDYFHELSHDFNHVMRLSRQIDSPPGQLTIHPRETVESLDERTVAGELDASQSKRRREHSLIG